MASFGSRHQAGIIDTVDPAMNVHYLELFYYVARHEGITSAVRHMPFGIQQPAVSAQLLKLEEQLGAKLFERRPFRLTRQGRELYTFVEPFFSGLPRVAERISGQGDQHLRLGASAMVLGHFLPILLDRLRADFADLRVTLRQVSPIEAETLLRSEEIDLAITARPVRAIAGMKTEELISLPLSLLVHEDSPWRTFDDFAAAAVEKVIPEPLISIPPLEPMHQLFEKGLAERGLRWPVQLEINHLELVQNYVAQGFGCGLFTVIPGWTYPPRTRTLTLEDFPQLSVVAYHRGYLNDVSRRLVELAARVATGLARS